MKIFIMRHGDAVATAKGETDAERRLSREGELEVATNANWLAEQLAGDALSLALVSPYTRAQQTATIVHSLVKSNVQETCKDITPDSSAEQFLDYLTARLALAAEQKHEIASVLIVSHMPFVSYLVSEFDPRIQPPIFPTAGIAEIDYDVDSAKGKLANLIIADRCV